jgi:hypothetical protein
MKLVALFPRSWRQRYGEEFEALLEETGLSPRDLIDVLHGVWDARVRPQPHLGIGGHAMSANLRRGLWSVPAALAALVLMVVLQSLSTGAFIGRALPVDPTAIWMTALAIVLGTVAAVLWRWRRLRPVWLFLALLAVRSLQLSLTGVFLTWSHGALAAPLYWQMGPLGYGWLPPTLVELAAGVVLVAALARFLRLRLVTAVIVGLTLELLIGASDLSLFRFLLLNGLEEAAMFVSPVTSAGPGQIAGAVQDPLAYLTLVGPIIWAFALQQVALRPEKGGVPQHLGRAYLAFTRAHWAPLAVLALVVVLARFPLPAYLTSATVQNPAHFTPTGTDVQAQFRDCLKAYGVNLPPGASTKTAAIPQGVGQRCANIINTYPAQVKGRPLPVPAPVTAGGVTYTVTSVQVAGNVLRIDWRASGPPMDEFGASAYPAQPPSDRRATSNRFELLFMQYFRPAVLDGAGNQVQGPGGGGGLPRTRPYAWHGQTVALIPGSGQYTLELGCDTPVELPTGKGSVGGGCSGGAPNATITIVVS